MTLPAGNDRHGRANHPALETVPPGSRRRRVLARLPRLDRAHVTSPSLELRIVPKLGAGKLAKKVDICWTDPGALQPVLPDHPRARDPSGRKGSPGLSPPYARHSGGRGTLPRRSTGRAIWAGLGSLVEPIVICPIRR